MKDTIEIGLLAAILALLARRELPLPTKKRTGGLVMDSCALIDGRVLALASSGLITEDVIIPQFILRELQLLADGSDSHKRDRARFGLDVAAQLQEGAGIQIRIDQTDFANLRTTDDKLIALAKMRKSRLFTTDLNLNKVATVEGVKVCNINEIAQDMRPFMLPGETVKVKIVQKGSSRGQGVGYLEDGTMIVVDETARVIGKTVEVKIVRMHQTVAGKMAFASLVGK